MLIVQWFVSATRYGTLGIFWLAAIAALIGFGLGPVMTYYIQTQPSTVTSAAVLTFAVVLGMGAAGFAWSKDTVRWMRPLSFVVLGCVIITIGAMLFGGLGSLSPVISAIVLVASALLILVDFNYVRACAWSGRARGRTGRRQPGCARAVGCSRCCRWRHETLVSLKFPLNTVCVSGSAMTLQLPRPERTVGNACAHPVVSVTLQRRRSTTATSPAGCSKLASAT